MFMVIVLEKESLVLGEHIETMDINREAICLNKLGKGDHKAFDDLFMQYQPRVKNFLKGFVKDEEEALDMTQEIFFRIWVNREIISKVDSFKAYLFRMAKNMIYDYYEHNLIKDTYNLRQKENSLYTDILDIEEKIYADELSLLIDIAVENMPDQRKRIFKMSRKEGLSNDEIASCLGINKRTVENHITTALAELRKMISCTISVFF